MVDRIERRIDLPRDLVWDALVDPVLAEGWLHPTERLTEPADVVLWDEPAALETESEALGHVRILLLDLPGGSRSRSTGIVISLLGPDGEGRAAEIAMWTIRLDQLADLLRGHPVEWENWERDHRSAYESYLAEAASGR